jgi:hypothetical protein
MLEEEIMNPSRPLVLTIALLALVAFVLGLTTDVGLVGWSLAALLALYLAVAGTTRIARRRSDSAHA